MRVKYGVEDGDIYNFDETGFMMGVIGSSMIITDKDRQGRRKAIQPGNREWATAVICISGLGDILPPFIILKAKVHQSTWYTETDIPSDWIIKTTTNGWTDNITSLEWLKHFDRNTKRRAKGPYRMLILDGHKSHESVEFQEYCRSNSIITLCLPPHSSHLTQPLDVGCFRPLKQVYSHEIELYIKAHINHITKTEFLIAFRSAFNKAITQQNAQGGFRGSGLIPYNPETVISKLDIKLRTPTPPLPLLIPATAWQSQTPQNSTEALLQSTLVKNRITQYQGSSPTPTFQAVASLAKGTELLAHQNTLLHAEIHTLRTANEALSKRRRAKKKQIRSEQALTVEDAIDLISQKEVVKQIRRDGSVLEGSQNRGLLKEKRCSICSKTGHNVRTCKVTVSVYSSSDDEIA